MKRFLLMLVLSLAILAGPVRAQETPTLSNLEISFWPEFDQPEMLVIYRGTLSPDTALPVPVEIRIPADVGQPTAVAYVDDAGQRFNQQYTTRVEGDWLVVAFDLAAQGFQLEYYNPLAVDANNQRQYAFDHVADYPITSLNLEFQVPPTAQDFVLDPAADTVRQEGDGLTYHLVQRGPVEQGESQTWTLTYQKGDEDLTISAFAQPAAPVPTAAPATGGSDNSTVLIFLVAFVALVGVGAAAFWLGRRAQLDSPADSPPPRRQKRRGSGQGVQPQLRNLPPSGGTAALFCHQCGADLRPDSVFCHRCGSSVRGG